MFALILNCEYIYSLYVLFFHVISGNTRVILSSHDYISGCMQPICSLRTWWVPTWLMRSLRRWVPHLIRAASMTPQLHLHHPSTQTNPHRRGYSIHHHVHKPVSMIQSEVVVTVLQILSCACDSVAQCHKYSFPLHLVEKSRHVWTNCYMFLPALHSTAHSWTRICLYFYQISPC